jgi:5-methylcytosine-specific restriction endonuclease McrBC GTP-binding regulatory subunit McrB
VSGAILPFLKAATDDPKHPYILCLDEMNLARVEYYMSDFLSIIESRDLRDGKIISDLIILSQNAGL